MKYRIDKPAGIFSYKTWRKYRIDKPAEIFIIKHGENID